MAMDVKNSPGMYGQTAGLENPDLALTEKSLGLLLTGRTDYELRTTLVAQLHSEKSIREMGQWVAGLIPGKLPKKWFLQRFVDRDTVAFAGLRAPEENDVFRYADILRPYGEQVVVRGE